MPFPMDIWRLLLREYLPAHDALRLSWTCKKLYAVFSKDERRHLEAGVHRTQVIHRFDYDKDVYSMCMYCHELVKSRKIRMHMERKCMGFSRFLNSKDYLICTQCKHTVRAERLQWHKTERCGALWCGIKKEQCIECKRRFPENLRKRRCDICCRTMLLIPTCPQCPARCYPCGIRRCTHCHVSYDPFGVEIHECTSFLGRVAKWFDVNLSSVIQDDSDSPYVRIHRDILYFVPSLHEIPPLTHDSLVVFWDTTRELIPVVTFHPGASIWHIELERVPKHCAQCATTAGSFKLCSGCGWSFYCSKACQAKHWKKVHRYHCLD